MPTAPRQMYHHCLNYIKGWFDVSAVDFDAYLSSAVVKSPIYSGSVLTLNSSGEFVPGGTTTRMPMYAIPSDDDPDVANYGGNDWKAVQPRGKMSALVAIGGYELETTEINTADTYPVNALLTSPLEATVGAGYESQAGLLYHKQSWHGGNNATVVVSTNWICGVVSKTKYTNAHGQTVIAFWSYFLPSGV